jgi:rubrerythrin
MIENENESFLIRWRGRQEGPYAVAVIEAKLAANQIGLLHEISHNGQWITLRDYLAERDAILRAERQAREEQERRVREEAERQAKEREEQARIATQNEEKSKATSQPQQEAIASTHEPLCRTCELGRLLKLNQYRMSLPVVIIGYFLLVPSAIGMLLNILGLIFYLIGAGSVVSQSATPDKGLTVLATTLGSAFFLFFLVLSFVGGVFGWLLIMKKKVLQCTHCGAVVAAS